MTVTVGNEGNVIVIEPSGETVTVKSTGDEISVD